MKYLLRNHNYEDAFRIMFNNIRKQCGFVSELSNKAETATAEEAPAIIADIEVVQQDTQSLVVDANELSNFRNIDTEMSVINSIINQCQSLVRKLNAIIAKAQKLNVLNKQFNASELSNE